MKLTLRTLIIAASLTLAAISSAQGAWSYVGTVVHPTLHVDAGTGFYATVTATPSNGGLTETLFVKETIGPFINIVDAVSTHLLSTSYIDFKWVVPYSYPIIACQGTGNIVGLITGSGALSSAIGGLYRAQGSISGCVSGDYNSIWTESGLTNTVNWNWSSGPNLIDSNGYYHCYVPLPTNSAYASVNMNSNYTGSDSETISSKLTINVLTYN